MISLANTYFLQCGKMAHHLMVHCFSKYVLKLNLGRTDIYKIVIHLLILFLSWEYMVTYLPSQIMATSSCIRTSDRW